MDSGTISNNTAKYGGGMYVYYGVLNMHGGNITSNKVTGSGGVLINIGDFNVSGSACITDNAVGTVPNNVYLQSGQTISVTGAFTSSMGITKEGSIGTAVIGNVIKLFLYHRRPVALTPVEVVTYSNNLTNNQLKNMNGIPITYTTSGNIESYNGWNFSWDDTKLTGMNRIGNTLSYQYNSDNIRTSKTVNGITTTYTLDGTQITSETNGTDTICYFYDADGALRFMTLNGTAYYYQKNLQGDIVGLVDSSNAQVVKYTYDTWGKLISITGSLASTVGVKNPMRYRGYYYDDETGFYSLQSRYYDPEIGRFINADAPEMLMLASLTGDVLDTNLFSDCHNNPVNLSDTTGYSPRWYHLAQAVYKIGKGLIALGTALAKGFVRSALGSIAVKVIGFTIGTALAALPLGQWWATVINVNAHICHLTKQ